MLPIQAPNSPYWSAVTIGILKEYFASIGVSVTEQQVKAIVKEYVDINAITSAQCLEQIKATTYTKEESDARYLSFKIYTDK